ncbi:putative ABC transporter ATP-binding protein [Clostridia bacterium]|nr:putative ABC transporter ATP-binding protein [Clostridia bacterium]
MVKIEELSVIYPDKTKAISNVTLNIKAGESVALIGANGAGKTSLLLALVGILEPSLGKIEIDNIQLNKKTLNEIRSRVGFVFQNPDDQLFMPSIYDDIAFGPRNFGLNEDEVSIAVNNTLAKLHIEHLKNRTALKLSGGEKRIAGVATVLAMQPAVMLFDEPTAFLDPKARRSLITLLNSLTHTNIIATHDLHFAAEVCSRVILLKKGEITADGETKLLYNKTLMENCELEAI